MYGGVETFLATLAREAAAAPGMESAFALCFEGRLSEELAALGHAAYPLGGVRLSRPRTVLRARRALRAVLSREAFDVVVCHQPWTSVVLGGEVRQAGFPLVMWEHTAGDGRHWLERLVGLQRPDLVICNSRYSVSRVSGWVESTRIEQLYFPVSRRPVESTGQARTEQRCRHQTASDDVVIAQVSRLEAWKGHRVLLSALAELRQVPGWTCWIVGGAQGAQQHRYLQELRALAMQLGLEPRVRFVGESRRVPDLMTAVDVLCQPNVAPEPFGIALIEAMQAGVPVVTSGIGGPCEVVDGTCGVLTAPGDVSTVSRALTRLIIEPELRHQLGREARRKADQLCDASRQMQAMQRLMAKALPTATGAGLVEVELR